MTIEADVVPSTRSVAEGWLNSALIVAALRGDSA
jgi:hypothetical protein